MTNKEKQLVEKHELAESVYMSGYGLLLQDCSDIAEQLYTEGYRKQRKLTSVEGESCTFCENLKKTKEDWAYFQSSSPRRCVQTARKEYKVALIEETYEEDVEYRTGLITHQHMELNFCPVCGKKIEK